jgi:hypothetical protein
MKLSENFDFVFRPPDPSGVWLHKSKPVWIRFYAAVDGVRFAYYQAYRSVERVPSGRAPWSVDNRRLGHPDHGYPTLESAMQAAEEVKIA